MRASMDRALSNDNHKSTATSAGSVGKALALGDFKTSELNPGVRWRKLRIADGVEVDWARGWKRSTGHGCQRMREDARGGRGRERPGPDVRGVLRPQY